MSHIAEVYAKDLGIKIGQPIFKPHYFPITYDNYITIHSDNKSQSRDYDYWDEVILLVKKHEPTINFIQIGCGTEKRMNNATAFVKTNSLKQSAFLIKYSLMHVGIDSCPVHIASSLNKPIVSIYGSCYKENSKPLWGDEDKHILLEPEFDVRPSFSFEDSKKQINNIYPEKIATAILKLLGKEKPNFETLYIGDKYKQQSLEVIPDNQYDLKENNINIRLDLLHEEENIKHLLSKNICSITTSKPLLDETLKFKSILAIRYVADSFDEEFVKKCIKLGKNIILFCTSEKNLSKERMKFFDLNILHYDKQKLIEKRKKNLTLNQFSYSSNRKVLKDKILHPSHYAANLKENLDDFYLDLEFMYVYTIENE